MPYTFTQNSITNSPPKLAVLLVCIPRYTDFLCRFGDLVPGNSYIYNVGEDTSEQEAGAKLVLGSVYLLLGMGIIGMCVNLMQEKIFTQVL